MSITAIGRTNQVMLQINGLQDMQTKAIRRSLYDIGKILRSDTVRFINEKPKHGVVYRIRKSVGGKGLKRIKDYTASAPGEAPGVITGKERGSIGFEVHGSDELEFGARGGQDGVDYAKYLEYGNMISMSGQGSKNIKPRPHISRAYAERKNYIKTRFENETRNALMNKP